MQLVDCIGANAAETNGLLHRALTARSIHRRFDPSMALLRVSVVRTATERWLLGFVFHHAIVDLHSAWIVSAEVVGAYSAALAEPSTSPPTSLSTSPSTSLSQASPSQPSSSGTSPLDQVLDLPAIESSAAGGAVAETPDDGTRSSAGSARLGGREKGGGEGWRGKRGPARINTEVRTLPGRFLSTADAKVLSRSALAERGFDGRLGLCTLCAPPNAGKDHGDWDESWGGVLRHCFSCAHASPYQVMLAVLVATLIQRAHDDASGGRGELDEVTEASNTPFDDKGQREPTEPLVGASAPSK